MSAPIKPLTQNFAVAPQLGPDDMADVAAAGYKSVIINRPDFEGGPDQPTAADVSRAAQEAGLHRIPPRRGQRHDGRRRRALCGTAAHPAGPGPGILPHRHPLHEPVRGCPTVGINPALTLVKAAGSTDVDPAAFR